MPPRVFGFSPWGRSWKKIEEGSKMTGLQLDAVKKSPTERTERTRLLCLLRIFARSMCNCLHFTEDLPANRTSKATSNNLGPKSTRIKTGKFYMVCSFSIEVPAFSMDSFGGIISIFCDLGNKILQDARLWIEAVMCYCRDGLLEYRMTIQLVDSCWFHTSRPWSMGASTLRTSELPFDQAVESRDCSLKGMASLDSWRFNFIMFSFKQSSWTWKALRCFQHLPTWGALQGWTGPQSFDFLDDNLRNVSLIRIQVKVMWKKQHLKDIFLFSGFSWTFFLTTCVLEERFLQIVCMW